MVRSGQVDLLELEPLRAVDGHHPDRVAGALERPALGLVGALAHRGAKLREETVRRLVSREAFRELAEEAVEVRETVAPLEARRRDELGPDGGAQAVDPELGALAMKGSPALSEGSGGSREGGGPGGERGEVRVRIGRRRPGRALDGGFERRERPGVGAGETRELLRDSGCEERTQGGVGHAHPGRAKPADEGGKIGRIEKSPHERGGVDGLAAPEIAAVLLDREGDPALAQRLEVAVDRSRRAEEERGIPRLHEAGFDSALQVVGDRRGFAARALAGAQRLARRGVPGGPVFDLRRGSFPLAGGDEPRVRDGDLRGDAHDGRHGPLDLGEDPLVGAEVRDQRFRAFPLERAVDELEVGCEARAAPAVDRLLGVSDQEEAGALSRGTFESEPGDDLALQLIGVLELVDQELADAAPRVARHAVVREEIGGEPQQIREGGGPAGAHPPFDLGGERRENLARRVEALGVEPLEQGERGVEAARGAGDLCGSRAEVRLLGLVEAPFAPLPEPLAGPGWRELRERRGEGDEPGARGRRRRERAGERWKRPRGFDRVLRVGR